MFDYSSDLLVSTSVRDLRMYIVKHFWNIPDSVDFLEYYPKYPEYIVKMNRSLYRFP